MDHLTRSKQLVANGGMDAFLVSSMSNMRYYSGFTGDSGVLLVGRDERFLVTDFRYREQAMEEASGYVYVECSAERPLWRAVAELAAALNASTLGFEEDHMVYGAYWAMTEQVKGEWQAASCIMAAQRAVKDGEELALMRRAAQIGDEAFAHMLTYIQPGMTEKDIALELEFFMRRAGASGNSFDPIVASGPNGSRPHAVPGMREIQGDMITLDFGCVVEGYCSDMTRTIAVGRLAEEPLSVYNIVLKAQMAAAEAARAGMSGRETDAVARNIIADYGYREHFGHGLGHSLGIDVHEEPRYSPSCPDEIRAGTMMTIEPGIYLDGRYGVRIEDFGVVTPEGFEAFCRSPKELLYI